MRRVGLTLVWLGLLAAVSSGDVVSPIPADTRQLLLVVTPSWSAQVGEMTWYLRGDPEGAWVASGAGIPVRVGRNGLAWGRGIHTEQGAGPVKQEGDGRAPAGVFLLSGLFGAQAGDLEPAIHLPFYLVGPDSVGVDDPESRHYNRVIEASEHDVDWQSAERMQIPQYRWGVFVDHNASDPIPGGGSCIFIHIWEAPDISTSGCTACSQDNMKKLVHWLRRSDKPVLVQLPGPMYGELKDSWGLP